MISRFVASVSRVFYDQMDRTEMLNSVGHIFRFITRRLNHMMTIEINSSNV